MSIGVMSDPPPTPDVPPIGRRQTRRPSSGSIACMAGLRPLAVSQTKSLCDNIGALTMRIRTDPMLCRSPRPKIKDLTARCPNKLNGNTRYSGRASGGRATNKRPFLCLRGGPNAQQIAPTQRRPRLFLAHFVAEGFHAVAIP